MLFILTLTFTFTLALILTFIQTFALAFSKAPALAFAAGFVFMRFTCDIMVLDVTPLHELLLEHYGVARVDALTEGVFLNQV